MIINDILLIALFNISRFYHIYVTSICDITRMSMILCFLSIASLLIKIFSLNNYFFLKFISVDMSKHDS